MLATEKAPDWFCITERKYREKTLIFIKRVIYIVHETDRPLHIDLSTIKFATAAASVLLFAVLNRAQFVLGNKLKVRISLPKKETNPSGHRCIVRTGLARALMANTLDKLDALVGQKRYFQSSVNPEVALATTMTMLTEKALLDENQTTLLMMGINEAMLNVKNHAYLGEEQNTIAELMGGSRWWQCTWFDPENDELVFIICDLGIGIAASYTNENFEPTTQFMVEHSHVKHALTNGNSRFREAGRGNGSEDIKRPVGLGSNKHEALMVFTGNTLYLYDSDSAHGIAETSILKPSIPGTIIHWTLTLNRG